MRRLVIAALGALLLTPGAARAQSSPSPYTSATRYDGGGRVTGTISADPDTVGSGNPFLAVRNSYDAAGRLTTVETGTLSTWQAETVAPASWGSAFTVLRTQETLYDNMSRKTRETLREGAAGTIRSVTQYSYDSLGRLDCTAIRMNAADFSSPPSSACTQGTGGADRITRASYDQADRRTQLREGVGTSIEATEATWDYNVMDQVVTVIDGNGNQAALVYDGFGRQECWMFPSTTGPSSFNDATQATALSTKGALSGSINSAGHCSGTGAIFETYEYDPQGNRIKLTKRDGSTLVFAYDWLNRVTTKTPTPGSGRTSSQTLTSAQYRPVYYGYDLRNLQLYARFDSASGEGVTSAWDGFGRLASSSTNMGGTTRTLSYEYDRDGDRTQIVHPGGAVFDQSYDGLDRPVLLSGPVAGTPYFINYTAHGAPGNTSRNTCCDATYFTWDGIQRLSALVDDHPGSGSDVTSWYSRNAAGQLSSVTRTNDAYAWTGHYAVQRSYATNGRNQYTNAGSAGFTYDDNGNLMTSPGPGSGEVLTYVYDVENRLVGRTSTGSSPTATLAYDPLGRLYRVSTASTDTRFLYDGDALVVEYDSSGAMTHRYVHNVGADVPVVQYDGSGLTTARHLFANHQGSIVAISDGTTTTLNTYDEYGIPGSANTGRFQYTGQIWLPEIGMYHYKARIYSPTLGRFLQTDPVGYADQFNLYAYVGNDPMNNSDPSGNWSYAVHNLILAEVLWRRPYTRFFIGLAQQVSLDQDIGEESTNNHAHFLRSPGEDRQMARQAWSNYVVREGRLARAAFLRGDIRGAITHGTKGAHAIQDAFSPVHNRDGYPAEYFDFPNSSSLRDALRQNHSPVDFQGGERTADMSGRVHQMMFTAVDNYFSEILAPGRIQCSNSRILQTHC